MGKRILFVCMGNICRSPAGEGVAESYIRQRGLAAQITVDSAGTIDHHSGEPADRRMRLAAERRGYQLNSRARQVESADFERFDLIVAMDRANRDDLLQQAANDAQRKKVRLLGSFIDAAERDVPDPYYGGSDGFERVLDMIESAMPNIIATVRAQ
ncbi:MAG: low molecular weight phosphotyrosine protein phosphatase [Deltaproteobacteria bacterium]|nr:low molecular weight phosphotyrosine protein phosphatase [Deltaproteobacteria bacterium]